MGQAGKNEEGHENTLSREIKEWKIEMDKFYGKLSDLKGMPIVSLFLYEEAVDQKGSEGLIWVTVDRITIGYKSEVYEDMIRQTEEFKEAKRLGEEMWGQGNDGIKKPLLKGL